MVQSMVDGQGWLVDEVADRQNCSKASDGPVLAVRYTIL